MGPIKHDANEDNISTANIITSTIAANVVFLHFVQIYLNFRGHFDMWTRSQGSNQPEPTYTDLFDYVILLILLQHYDIYTKCSIISIFNKVYINYH